jgi:hypothetical protein
MEIKSPNVHYSENFIDVMYEYQTTIVEKEKSGKLMVSFKLLNFLVISGFIKIRVLISFEIEIN